MTIRFAATVVRRVRLGSLAARVDVAARETPARTRIHDAPPTIMEANMSVSAAVMTPRTAIVHRATFPKVVKCQLSSAVTSAVISQGRSARVGQIFNALNGRRLQVRAALAA